MKVSFVHDVSMAFLSMLVASSTLQAQPSPPAQGDYRLGAGDVLSIVVWKNPDLTMTVPVRPDGWISMPLLNDVRAKGRTPMELQRDLTDRFSEYISDPVVSVIVNQVQSFKVSILGKVRGPSRYDLLGPTTVLDVLAMAGGPTEYADLNDMFLLRPDGETYHRIPVKYSSIVKPSGKSENVLVQPGDIIVVP